MNDEIEKLRVALKNLKRANKRLDEAFKEKYSQIVKDAVIQRFEFTFELAWKSMRQCLKARYDKSTNNPRDVIEDAYSHKIVEELETWKALLKTRNFTTHLYSDEESGKAYRMIKKNKNLFDDLIKKIADILKTSK